MARTAGAAGRSRIVVALDSFKGSIAAAAACEALAAGYADADGPAGGGTVGATTVLLRPMADGGEGTLDAFAAAIPGARRMPVRVRGPHGRDVDAEWLLLPDGAGVVELASTSGIELLGDERLPWDADTFGFGQAIAAALDHGVDRLVLGVGSSASTDGGAGMLAALGTRVTDANGQPVAPGARGLMEVASVDLSRLCSLPAGGAIVLSDVTNPLLGASGAAAVFGPQKGFAPSELAEVDGVLERWACLLGSDPSTAGSGAAGGTGFALAAWGARIAPGAGEVAELIDLNAAIAGAALVVTGEGAYDGQSAAGKVPSFVASRAQAAGVPVALVAGRIDPDADVSAFVEAISLTDLAGGSAAALSAPARWLHAAGSALAP